MLDLGPGCCCGGGDLALPGCPCVNIPRTLNLHCALVNAGSSPPYPCVLQYGPIPSDCAKAGDVFFDPTTGYFANPAHHAFWATTTSAATWNAPPSLGLHPWRMLFYCSGGFYELDTKFVTATNPNPFNGFGLASYLAGAGSNVCSPFSMHNPSYVGGAPPSWNAFVDGTGPP